MQTLAGSTTQSFNLRSSSLHVHLHSLSSDFLQLSSFKTFPLWCLFCFPFPRVCCPPNRVMRSPPLLPSYASSTRTVPVTFSNTHLYHFGKKGSRLWLPGARNGGWEGVPATLRGRGRELCLVLPIKDLESAHHTIKKINNLLKTLVWSSWEICIFFTSILFLAR